MHTILTAIRRLTTWLTAVDGSSEARVEPRDWSDLPVYHPASDRDR